MQWCNADELLSLLFFISLVSHTEVHTVVSTTSVCFDSSMETLDLTPLLAFTALISLQGEDRAPQSACVIFTKKQPSAAGGGGEQ